MSGTLFEEDGQQGRHPDGVPGTGQTWPLLPLFASFSEAPLLHIICFTGQSLEITIPDDLSCPLKP